MESKDVVDLQHRHTDLLSLRTGYEPAWQDLAKHFMPTSYRNVAQNPSAYKGQGLLNPDLYNSTGILAMRTLAAGLQGGMTSPARPWFQLSLGDADLGNYAPVKTWLGEVTKRMRKVFQRAAFYNAVHTLYGELGTFGTGFMLELADESDGFRFIPFRVGEYCLDTNDKQLVDVVFRRFQMSARQMVQRFGKDKVPKYVLTSAEHGNRKIGNDQRFVVVHAIYPRKDYAVDYGKRVGKNMPFASVYYMDGIAGENGKTSRHSSSGHVLSESGFEEFPGFGVRWDVCSNDVYGRSPAMECLPDCRMVQEMDKSILKAVHKGVDPPTAVTASLKSVGLDLTPGGVNYVEAAPGQAPQAAVPIMQYQADINFAQQKVIAIEHKIKEGLYNDLFRMLMDSDRRQITAREVQAKEEEKLILIGPVLERLHNELFIPLINRTFNAMYRLYSLNPNDTLPPPPEILNSPEYANTEIKVEFVSLLAQAQKLVSTSAVDRLLAVSGTVAGMHPEALDTLNPDKTIDEYADYLGVDPSILRSQEERDQIRKQRAEAQAAAEQAAQQQMQQAQMMQSVQGATDTAQTLASMPLDQNTALDAIIGGMGAI